MRTFHVVLTRNKVGLLLGALGLALVLVLAIPGSPKRATPLTIATNVWVGYEPLYLARDLKFWTPEQVRLVECSSATQVQRLFKNGTVDAAALTLDEAIRLSLAGVDLRVILILDVSHGADVIMAQEEFSDLAALKGQRVGIESTALGAYVLSRACQIAGLDLAELEIVPIEIHEHRQAFLAKRVDAVVTFEPVRSQLLSVGAKELFSSKEIPGEIVDVLVVRPRLLAGRSRALSTVVRGWFQALSHLRAQPEDAASRMAARLGLAPSQVLDSYTGLSLPSRAENLAWLSGSPPKLTAVARRLQAEMLKHGLVSHSAPISEWASPTALSGSQ